MSASLFNLHRDAWDAVGQVSRGRPIKVQESPPLPPLTPLAPAVDVASTKKATTPPLGRECKAEGCMKYHISKCMGYCLEHFQIFETNKELVKRIITEKDVAKRCKVQGCRRKKIAGRCKGYCQKHWDEGKHQFTADSAQEKATSEPRTIQLDAASSTLAACVSPTRKTNSPLPGRGCKAEACMKYHISKCRGYCLEHFQVYEPDKELVERIVAEKDAAKRCKVEGCRRKKVALRCQGFCQKHWDEFAKDHAAISSGKSNQEKPSVSRKRKLPTSISVKKTKFPPSGRGCKAEGCLKYHISKCGGFCLEHFQVFEPDRELVERLVAEKDAAKKCKAEGCNKKKWGSNWVAGYCRKHYNENC